MQILSNIIHTTMLVVMWRLVAFFPHQLQNIMQSEQKNLPTSDLFVVVLVAQLSIFVVIVVR